MIFSPGFLFDLKDKLIFFGNYSNSNSINNNNKNNVVAIRLGLKFP